MFNFSAANKLCIFKDKWFKNTALLRLNKNQFFIFLIIAFLISVCSYFCAIDLYKSLSFGYVASVDVTIDVRSFLSSCLVIYIYWMIFLS